MNRTTLLTIVATLALAACGADAPERRSPPPPIREVNGLSFSAEGCVGSYSGPPDGGASAASRR